MKKIIYFSLFLCSLSLLSSFEDYKIEAEKTFGSVKGVSLARVCFGREVIEEGLLQYGGVPASEYTHPDKEEHYSDKFKRVLAGFYRMELDAKRVSKIKEENILLRKKIEELEADSDSNLEKENVRLRKKIEELEKGSDLKAFQNRCRKLLEKDDSPKHESPKSSTEIPIFRRS